ncbi:MAG: hypothetical protein QXJ06_05095 [Candidatus Aenigmatarchaeota archaeon]
MQLNIALQNNSAVLLNKEKISSSSASIKEAKSAKGPKLSFETSSTKYQQEMKDYWSFPKSVEIPSLSGVIFIRCNKCIWNKYSFYNKSYYNRTPTAFFPYSIWKWC